MVDENETRGVFGPTGIAGTFRNQHPCHSLGQPLDAAGEIDRVTDGSVIQTLGGTDETDDGRPAMDADANIETGTCGTQFLTKGEQALL